MISGLEQSLIDISSLMRKGQEERLTLEDNNSQLQSQIKTVENLLKNQQLVIVQFQKKNSAQEAAVKQVD